MAVIKMNFLSEALGMQTNVTVCLPSYSFKDKMEGREDVYVPGMKYQVLWLLHGGTGDDSDYLNFSNITRYADDHKLAVVMPADYNAFYTDTASAKYFSFVVDELPKVMRALFPLSDKREDNFVGGLSMGSGGAMKCALLRPEMYEAALIMSGPGMRLHRPEDKTAVEFLEKVIAGEDISSYKAVTPYEEDIQMAVPAYEIIKEKKDQLPKLFFACGGDDFLKSHVELGLRFYDTMGVEYQYEEIPGYKHEWDFWDLTLRKAINEWLPIRHSAIYPEE